MLISLSPRARAVIDRLAKVDLANPVIDRAAAERAMRRYLAASGLPVKPIHWVSDVAEGQPSYSRMSLIRTIWSGNSSPGQ